MSDATPRFSLIVPIYDERDNIDALLDEIAEVLAPVAPFEVVLVDDKSKDDSVERILAWKRKHGADWLRLLCMQKNGGQSAAVLAGAMHSRAPFVMTMDGDRQNDPRDLVTMLGILERKEADGVTGIRKNRRDTFVRRMSSKIGNGVRNWLTGDRVADSGCGIKGYRRDLFLMVPRFNGMHRFMATLVRYCGGKVQEVAVNHRPRVAGKAKYGIGNRALRGLRDCFAMRWFRQRILVFAADERRA
ncbi:MAG: glycosyltransferase family 2 protein [Planctomycetota bacterium]